MRNRTQRRLRGKVITDILEVIGVPMPWRKTTYGLSQVIVALVGEFKKGRFTSDLEVVDFQTIVEIEEKSTINARTFGTQHKIYIDGSSPLARTGVIFMHGIGLGADTQLVMDLASEAGFSDPKTVLPTVQILNQTGFVLIKKNGKVLIDVQASRARILNKIANLGNTGKIYRPTQLISFPLYALATQVTQADEVSTGDFYRTAERVFIGDRLMNVGMTKRRPHAKLGRSKPIPYNLDTPYFNQAVAQGRNTVAMARDFGVNNVRQLTEQVMNSRRGVGIMVKTIGGYWVKTNKDHSQVAAKAYEFLMANPEFSAEVEERFVDIIAVADDGVNETPIKELVLAGPTVDQDTSYGLPQASWTPPVTTPTSN